MPGDNFDLKNQPTLLEPMKLKKSTLLSSTSFVASSKVSGITKKHLFFGKPDSCNISIIFRHERGVSSAGLTTTIQPVAIAGII